MFYLFEDSAAHLNPTLNCSKAVTIHPNIGIGGEMTGAILVTLPPLILIALFQRRIVRGLTLSEK